MLHRKYMIVATVLAFCLNSASALDNAASTQFTFQQVEKQAGRILITPGYTTIIEFPDGVTNLFTGNSNLLSKVYFSGKLVTLSAVKSVGQTDLVITVGDRIALFVVQIDPLGKAPRRYSVVDPAAAVPKVAPPAQVVTPTPAPATPPAVPVPVPPAAPKVATPRPAAPVPAAATGPKQAELLSKYEAERAILYRTDAVDVFGASGGRLVQHINQGASRVTFPTIRAPSSGVYTLRVRYTNGYSKAATQPMVINSQSVPEVRYPPTGDWDKFGTVDVQVTLRQGNNTIRFGAAEGVATLDALELWGTQTGEAAQVPPPSVSVQASAPAPAPTPGKVASAAPAPAAPSDSGRRVQIPLVNPGFDKDATGWDPWWDPALGGSVQSISTKGAHSGAGALSFAANRAYTQNISQVVKNLPNGTYTFEGWVRCTGGQAGVTFFALNYGGKELNVSVPVDVATNWTKYVIKDIRVTDGQVQIGLWNKSLGGAHAVELDDVALYREAAAK